MTHSAIADRQAPDPPPVGSLEARVSLGLKVLAGLNAVGLMLAILPAAAPAASLFTAISLVGRAAMTVLYAVEAIALDRSRTWAIAAARPLLVVLIVYGTLETALAASNGRVRLPFEAVIAIWAWVGARRSTKRPGQGPRGVALVGATVGLAAVVAFGRPLFAWGGVLDVRASNLDATLSLDCGALGSGQPAIITVTYDWSWSQGSPFPSGLDVVVIAWKGTDAEGRTLYLLGETPPSGAGVYQGLQGVPSLAMAREIERSWPGSWHWGIQLSEQQLRDGHIEMQLEQVRPGSGPFTLGASYVHLGLWRQDTAPVTCSW